MSHADTVLSSKQASKQASKQSVVCPFPAVKPFSQNFIVNKKDRTVYRHSISVSARGAVFFLFLLGSPCRRDPASP